MANGVQHSNGGTSMDMVYSIEKFASFLVMKYSKLNCIDPEFTKAFEAFTNLKISEGIFDCINLLLKHYKEIIAEVSIDIFVDMAYLSSKSEYMKQLLARCLKLSGDDPTFFEFLLVCLYIGRISECLYDKYGCCKVLKVTADCLKAVYWRKYWDYFQQNEGFLGLSYFCRNLSYEEPMQDVPKEDGEDPTVFLPSLDPPQRNEMVKILKTLNGFHNAIELNDVERKQIAMLMNKPYFKGIRQNEDFLITTIVTRETAVDDDLETFSCIDEKTNKTGLRCDQCEAKCAQYPKDLINELKSNEKIKVNSEYVYV